MRIFGVDDGVLSILIGIFVYFSKVIEAEQTDEQAHVLIHETYQFL
jgi:hypothetical protein